MSRVLVIGSDNQVSRGIGDALSAIDVPMEYSAGHADALQRLRMRSFGVVITNPDSTVEEDLALLGEMRAIRPGVKSIVLARQSTADEVIAALRARVFACFTPPFDPEEIANLARGGASDSQGLDDMQVLSAKPGWVSVRVNCRLITAERLITFANELSAELPEDTRQERANRAQQKQSSETMMAKSYSVIFGLPEKPLASRRASASISLPPIITVRVFLRSPIRREGSPSTRTRSADLPTVIEPVVLSTPTRCAGAMVAAANASDGVNPAAT